MDIGRETKTKVVEKSTGGGGVEMLGKVTRNEAPHEAEGNGGHETRKEAKHRDRNSSGFCHGIHVQLH